MTLQTRDTTTVFDSLLTLRALFKAMLRIRRCEEALIEAYHPADLMRCPMHFCIGQEAAPAALSLVMEEQDLLLCHHRNHGYFLAKGGTMRRLFAEIHGKDTGSNRGLAGSQDISESQIGFYSGAIVSGATVIATGAAFATKLKGTNEIVIAVFGDGAMDQGVMWECFNIAALKRLPILYLCENNGYSTYSPISARHQVLDFVRKVESFGISSEVIKEGKPEQVVNQIRQLVTSVRSSRLPAFLEIETYRFCSHVGPEPDDYIGYRTEQELGAWKAKDPVELLRRTLVPTQISEEELAAIELDIKKEIEDAFDFAKKSPFPEKNLMFDALEHNGRRFQSAVPDTVKSGGLSLSFDPSQPDAKLRPY